MDDPSGERNGRACLKGNALASPSWLWFVMLLYIAFSGGCLPFIRLRPAAQASEAAPSLAAQVLSAQMTIRVGQTAIAQLTEIAIRSSSSPSPAFPSEQEPSQPPASDTPAPILPTDTPAPPTPSAVTIPCNQAIFVSDIGMPPGTQILTGSTFTKVWRVMNTGSCAWTRDYSIVFSGGNLASAAQAVFLPAAVQPGETTDLAVTLQAPIYPGDFQAFWMLREPSGQTFGVGPDAASPLEVRISTILPAYSSSSTYDLVAGYCTAAWTSDSGLLNCPGDTTDRDGSVTLIPSPVIENLQRSGYGLLTRPDNSSNGYINGQFPAYFVQSGDTFVSEIGCLQNSQGCNLTFRLEYQTSDGQSGTLGIWRESYDGSTTQVEIDLSSLAGRSVWLNLQVVNHGAWQAANGLWHQPRIQRSQVPSSSSLTWSRAGDPQATSCQELHIRLTGFSTGIADAYSCRTNLRELGSRSLTTSEVLQVQSWMQRFGDTNVELYSAPQPNAVTIWVSFNGSGSASASEADIRGIDSFAYDIFNSIAP